MSHHSAFNNPGLSHSKSNTIALNSLKVGITTTQANDITANNSKIGITTQQANDITANNLKVGITTTQATAVSNLASAIEIDSNGDTLLKSASGNKIQFYNSGNHLFSRIDIKTLTDNIVISQPVNLDQTELNIATNFSNINGIMNNTQTSTLKQRWIQTPLSEQQIQV